MKLPLTSIAGCTIAMALLATSHGTGYVTNFDSPATFTPNQTLSGQDSWDTNNFAAPNFGQSDFVGIVSGYSATASDNWGLLGGATSTAPVVTTSYLFRQFDLSGQTAATFDVDFGIISSQIPRTNADTFGWTFQNGTTAQLEAGTAAQLLRVAFVPDPVHSGQLIIRVFDGSNAELAGSGSFDIFYNSIYNLDVTISADSKVSVNVQDTLGNPGTQIVNNQTATGAVPSTITDVAATWTLADTSGQNGNGEYPNYGSNSEVFNNYSMLPEPSSAFLLATGVLGIMSRRRQRSS